ncbi:MAG: hypothetical protein QOC81_4577 [Thermoanaerobaculia bacterium]|nr:hypothetical protein [Thermoanaerobaculia bacterium]
MSSHSSALHSNRAPSPPRFSVGEKVPKADEGAFPFAANRRKIQHSKPPTSGFATFSPRKKRGGRRRSMGGRRERLNQIVEWRFLCLKLMASHARRAPSPPRFSVGEKVPKADEGAFPLAASHPKIQHSKPPSSGFATFSPRKKRGGRRRSMGGRGESSNQTVEWGFLYLELTTPHARRAPSPPRFSVGEKVPKADEGAFPFAASYRKIQHSKPPSSGFATFSPRKKRGGRRRSMGGRGERFNQAGKDPK